MFLGIHLLLHWGWCACYLHLLTKPLSYCSFLTPSHFCRKDQKKVDKLTAQIPYHEGRGDKAEVDKIKEKIDAIWTKAKENFEA